MLGVTWPKVLKIEQISTSNSFYDQALELRYELFFKEYDLPRGIEKDDLEAQSYHFTISDQASLIGYGRLTDLGSGQFKISQVVVVPSFQRRGHGTALLQKIISFAQSNGAYSIELNSQVTATALYKNLGFNEFGAHYPSKTTGIPHAKMVHGAAT